MMEASLAVNYGMVSEPRAVATGSMRNFDHNTHCVSGRSCPSFRRRGCTSEFD